MSCEYCRGEEPVKAYAFAGMLGSIDIVINSQEKTIEASTIGFTSYYDANYCFHCGSKLGDSYE